MNQKMFDIVYIIVLISLFTHSKSTSLGEEEVNSETTTTIEIDEEGGEVSVNQLPGHGLGGGNEPTYDPYTIGAKHGFGNRGGKKPDVDDGILGRLRNTAENGNKDSLYFLGLFYYYGNGVPRSRSKAVEYFTEAAKLGHAEAKSNLGMI